MTQPKLTSREEFEFLAELILKHSPGEHTMFHLWDYDGGTTRFANNQVVQNLNARRISLSVTIAFGQRHGTATTSDLSVGAVREAVRRAESVALVSPPDPEYLPPPPSQAYPLVPSMRTETLTAGADRRLAEAQQAIGHCRQDRFQGAGIVASSFSVVGMAADTGLMAFEERTESEFSLTATREDATGWASQEHRSIDHLEVKKRTRAAMDKARRAVSPKELPPGPYTVVLEPPAVAGLMSGLLWRLEAKSYYKQTSPFSGRLGQPVVDSRLSLLNQPDHPDLLGVGFVSTGLPTQPRTWIERGVLRELDYDRYTAREHGVKTIATLDAPVVRMDGEAAGNLEELIGRTPRGILVTTFWYIRTVNATDLTLTGMTRDGTFLIENGRVAGPVHNFRFHESPLRAFNRILGFTTPMEAVSSESWKMLLPALQIADFNFSSVTRF